MVAKALWVTMLAVGVLSLSGLGYAAFTASTSVTMYGTGGHLDLAVQSFSTSTSQSYVGCTGTINTDGTLTVTAGPLAPGDWCDVTAVIENTGNVPATLTASSSTSTGFSSCFQSVLESSTPSTVAAGGTYNFHGAIELGDSAGNGCQSVTGSITWTFTASASTGETGEPTGI